jgi:uncharacterized membrane protein YhhN
MGELLANLPTASVALLPVAGALAIAATALGDRGARGLTAPGVRIVKTSVPAVLLAAVIVALAGSGNASEAGRLAGAVENGAGGSGPALPAPSQILFAVGMALTILADWWLAPVENSATFARGLAAFLAGYLLYAGALWYAALAPVGAGIGVGVPVAGSGGTPPVLAQPLGIVARLPLSAGLILAVLGVTGVTGLVQGRTLTGVAPELRGAVTAYMVVATLLLAGGILLFARTVGGDVPHTLPEAVSVRAAADGAAAGAATTDAPSSVATLLFAGTALIYLSDSLIAHNLFRRPLPREELWIMPTYYLGQGAVALAVVLAA